MRKAVLTALGAVAILAATNTAAFANHVSGGDFECVLNGSGQPVIGVRVDFAAFSSANKPISDITTRIDGTVRQVVTDYTFPGSSGSWPATGHAWFDTTPGSHHVSIVANWPHRSDEDTNRFSGDVSCPKPPPPPPPPPKPPVPPAPPVPPKVTPPPAPPVTPPPPPRTFKPKVTTMHVKAAFFNHDPRATAAACGLRIEVKHPGMKHGLQTWHGRSCLHGLQWSTARWYIGRYLAWSSKRHRYTGGHAITRRQQTHGVFAWAHGSVMRADLFAHVFDRPYAWGAYEIGLVVKRK